MNALFSIGQKVVCVDSKKTDLVEGKIYTIHGMTQCKCKRICVDVGLKLDPTKYVSWCQYCGSSEETFTYWIYQTRFVPLEFDRQADEEIHQALKGIKIEN